MSDLIPNCNPIAAASLAPCGRPITFGSRCGWSVVGRAPVPQSWTRGSELITTKQMVERAVLDAFHGRLDRVSEPPLTLRHGERIGLGLDRLLLLAEQRAVPPEPSPLPACEYARVFTARKVRLSRLHPTRDVLRSPHGDGAQLFCPVVVSVVVSVVFVVAQRGRRVRRGGGRATREVCRAALSV